MENESNTKPSFISKAYSSFFFFLGLKVITKKIRINSQKESKGLL